MAGVLPFRALAAFGLTGVLLLLLATPLCAVEFCPMGEKARAAGCRPLESDCCQSHGERSAPSPLQVMPPAPFASPSGSSVATAAAPALAEVSAGEPAPPAILQGIGLHAFLAVFLI